MVLKKQDGLPCAHRRLGGPEAGVVLLVAQGEGGADVEAPRGRGQQEEEEGEVCHVGVGGREGVGTGILSPVLTHLAAFSLATSKI